MGRAIWGSGRLRLANSGAERVCAAGWCMDGSQRAEGVTGRSRGWKQLLGCEQPAAGGGRERDLEGFDALTRSEQHATGRGEVTGKKRSRAPHHYPLTCTDHACVLRLFGEHQGAHISSCKHLFSPIAQQSPLPPYCPLSTIANDVALCTCSTCARALHVMQQKTAFSMWFTPNPHQHYQYI